MPTRRLCDGRVTAVRFVLSARGGVVPELRNRIETPARAPFEVPTLEGGYGGATLAPERLIRDDLRRQIARLERRLSELFASAFPRTGIEWRVGAIGGPRVLGVRDLERVRDALVVRLREAEAELDRRGEQEEATRGLLESMIAEPERHRWVRVAREDIGERGCGHYHSRPRWGILGMLLNWWRVRISSGCPLASG
jgi:hypothetical protein